MEKEQGKELLPVVEATLKWFNTPNGFGFLLPEEGDTTDAFVHITTLQDAGINALGEGARVLCHIDHSPKGAIVTKIVELLDPGDMPTTIPDKKTDRKSSNDEVFPMEGSVKWFCKEKGFGFVLADDGKKDVFIHQSCLKRSGIDILEPGSRVSMNIRNVNKGREALDIKIEE